MRYVAFLLGLVVLGAGTAGAQLNASNYTLIPPPAFSSSVNLTDPAVALPAAPAPSLAYTLTSAPASDPNPFLLPAAPAPKPQDVTSVFENYSWQAYLGYTYMRFYELPSITKSTNGYNFGIVYYITNHWGVDGEFQGSYLHQGGTDGWFLFAGGGPRFRWALPRNVEIWAHGLGGWSHFTPQTAAGFQQAAAWEVGGGLDFAFKPRWSLRVSADCMGTRYFDTYQFSPKASGGIVFKF
jgi:opacity protein-like surface antigen